MAGLCQLIVNPVACELTTPIEFIGPVEACQAVSTEGEDDLGVNDQGME